MSKLYNTKFKPTKAGLVQAAVDFVMKKIPRKKKVSPDIKSVKPNIKKTVKETKSDEYTKRIRELDSAEKKIKSGKEMMKEGQKVRKKMADTGRAFQFKSSKSYHPMKPGDKEKYGKNMKVAGPQKKFKTGKQLEAEKKARENKMGGGMMGRRMGYSQGKLAVTPREKQLAAQYGDKKRITRGDVITAAKKKSGEEPMRDRMKQPLKKKGS